MPEYISEGVLCQDCVLGQVDVLVAKFTNPDDFIQLISKNPPISYYHYYSNERIYLEDKTLDLVTLEFLILFDESGLLYRLQRPRIPDYNNINSQFEVRRGICLNPCDEYHLLCDYEYHPGWICAPIQPMDERFAKMYHKLK
jgi:hypothetical protein